MDRTRTSGFTIVELMLVVAIMGIVATFALPAFTDLIHSNRRAASVNDFLATIHLARSEAITRNGAVSVCRSNSAQASCLATAGPWQAGWVVFADADGNGELDAGEEILAVGGPLRGTFRLVSDEFTFAMTFFPSGRVRASSTDRFGELLLCSADDDVAERVIIIDRTGRPRVGTETLAGAAGDCSS